MIEIGKIKEGMTGRQVADLLYDNFLAVISGLGEYATEKWVTDKGYITKASLNGYATEQWVTGRGYITAAAVAEGYATIASVNELAGGVSASLAAVNAALAERVEKTKFAEYFSTEMAKWFVKDDANKGIKPVNSYGLYSDTYVSAKGVNTGTGGSGGGTSYDRLDSWAEYTSAKAGYVLSALLGYDLHTRVNNLANAGYITTSALSGYAKLSDIPTSLPASDVAAWAKAASKPSYAFSEIANKPTTLGGYGITDFVVKSTTDSIDNYVTKSGIYSWSYVAASSLPDTVGYGNSITINGGADTYLQIYGSYSINKGCGLFWRGSLTSNTTMAWKRILDSSNYSEYTYSQTTIDGKLSGYLPLSGGTIEDSIGGAFSVDRINASEAYIKLLSRGVFKGAITAGNDTYGVALYNAVNGYYLGITNDGNPYYIGASRYTLIHSGNIGSQSVAYATSAGDSDMLGGVTHSNYMISFRSNTQDVNQSPYTAERPYILRVGSGNANLPAGMQYGNIAHFSAYGADTAFELFGAYSGQTLLYRCGETNAMFSKGWKTIAFTDSNVASATKLQTPRSIWGQSFDGSADVGGNINLNTSRLYWHSDSSNYCIYSYYNGATTYLNIKDYGNILFHTAATERMRIANNGNVLIGTSSDNGSKLYVNGDVRFDGQTRISGSVRFYGKNNLSSDMYIDNQSVGGLNFALSDGVSRFFIGYNVGIGTNSPAEKLHVIGNIVATGSVTAKSSSDYRLKCAFDYGVDYQERLLSLGRVCDFNYTPHAQEREFAFADDKRHTSVIWQDARKANITGFCSVEEDGYGTINPLSSDLIFTMVGAIQQGITKTEKIEERVVRLEKENEALRKEINDMKGGRYGC